MIGIIDYNSGHIQNLASAVKRAGGEFTLFNGLPDEQIDKLIIYANINVCEFMSFLRKNQLDEFIANAISKKIPILAINNGLHVLYDYVSDISKNDVSETPNDAEFIEGLHLIHGRIKTLYQKIHADIHVGWHTLKTNREFGRKVKLNLLKGINVVQNAMFYFNQTNYIEPDDLSTVFAFSNYCEDAKNVIEKTDNVLIPAIINHENLWGVEFLPEKSERIGIRLLRNFVNFVPPNIAEDKNNT